MAGYKQSKVLVTGYTGLLGNTLCHQLVKNGFPVFGVARNILPLDDIEVFSLDLADKVKLEKLVGRIKPSIIFHTAALTNVDYCEEHPDEAYLVNVEITKNVVEVCKNTNSFLVYISTDFIFDGKRGNYSEEDTPNPLNVYGKTKLAGEKIVLESGIPYLIARTSIYGWNILPKQSMAEAVIAKLKSQTMFTPFVDQYFTPIYTGTFSKILVELVEKGRNGVYNIVTDGKISKFEFANQIAEVFGLDRKLLAGKHTSEVQFKAARPADVSLDNKKVKADLKIKEISLPADLRKMKEEEKFCGKN